MLARVAARHPLVYTFCTGIPYILFAAYLPDPFSYGAMLAWTIWRVHGCAGGMRIQARKSRCAAARYAARYGQPTANGD